MKAQAKNVEPANAHHDCEFRDMLSRVGDKWSLVVLLILEGMPGRRARFSALKRSIPGISQRMLTATVRNLERDGVGRGTSRFDARAGRKVAKTSAA